MRWDDASNTPSVPFFCRCYTSLSCAFIITPCKRHGSCRRRMLVMVACTLFTCFYHLCLVRSGKSSGMVVVLNGLSGASMWVASREALAISCNHHFPSWSLFLCCFKTFQIKHVWNIFDFSYLGRWSIYQDSCDWSHVSTKTHVNHCQAVMTAIQDFVNFRGYTISKMSVGRCAYNRVFSMRMM